MADKKISALTGATTPLAGTEVLPIVQSGATVKVAVSDLTAGRAVSATQLTSTIAIGTAPLVVTSTTNVANLNASSLNGATFAAPGAIGGGTASAITATVGTFTRQSPGGSGVIFTNTSATPFSGYLYSDNNMCGLSPTEGFTTGAGFFIQSTQAIIYSPDQTKTAALSNTGLTFTGINLVQGTAAKGIDFTANTPAAGMTSQLLNWYEEGSVTVTATTSTSGTITLSADTLRYVRTGKLVVINGLLTVSSVSSPVGYVKINGLPFSGGASTSSRCSISIVGEGLEVTMTTSLMASIQSDTIIYIFKNSGLGGQSNCAQDFKAGTSMFIGGTYITD